MTNPSTATSEKELIKLNKLFNVEFKNCSLKKLFKGQDLIKEYYGIYGTLECGYVDIKGEIAYAQSLNGTTVCSCSPRLSMPTRMTSPFFR